MPELIDIITSEFVAALLGAVVTVTLGFVVARLTFLRDRARLKRGEFHGQLLVQSHALLPDKQGHEVLCFTTERVYTTLSELFPNPALEKLFLDRAGHTGVTQPLIDLGSEADHAKRNIISHLSESVEGLEGSYVVLVTREAQDAVERKLNRVFLLQLQDLQRFKDWETVKTFHTEQPSHWPRLLNLHYSACRVLDEQGALKADQKAFYAEIVFGPRTVLGSHTVLWDEHLPTGPEAC